jgi:hypothetical protein
MHTDLDLSHLAADLQEQIYALIIKYWSVYDDHGVFVPVRNYECVFDTGDAHTIAVKKIMYGPQEIPIMRKAVAPHDKVGQLCRMHDEQWLFKAVLVLKPHQDHVRLIEDFVWRFFVKYVPFNLVTWVITYLICLRGVWTESVDVDV